MQIYLSDYRVSQTDELFFTDSRDMRQGKMRILRKMQTGLPDGCRCYRQFQKEEERNRMYSVHGMCKELSEEGIVNIKPKNEPLYKLVFLQRSFEYEKQDYYILS